MKKAIALAAVQDAIAARYPGGSIELVAQVHYIRPDDVAHIDVYGCDEPVQRRAVRTKAVRLLQELGVRVELVGGHDVFMLSPDFTDQAALSAYASRLESIA